MEKDNKYRLCVRCFTYNQAPYIEDALNGFCIQKTNFPFVCTIVDDASTDGEQEVIKRYLQENFDLEDKSIVRNEDTDDYFLTFARHKTNHNCYFVVLYLKCNHHSIKKSKMPYISEWQDNCKYIAICEGDDYWIDPYKLQKQVDFMENHPLYTMCCSDARIVTTNGEHDWHRYESDTDISVQDMVLGGGLFVQTATILYRKQLLENYPDCCKLCHVGDYPLQIWSTLNGSVRYFATKTTVYRFCREGSWTSESTKKSIELMIRGWRTEVDMLKGLDVFSGNKYHDFFVKRCTDYIYGLLKARPNDWGKISSAFPDVICDFIMPKKIENFLMCHRLRKLACIWMLYYYDGIKAVLVSLPVFRRIYQWKKHGKDY